MTFRVFGSAVVLGCLAAPLLGAQVANQQVPPRDTPVAPSKTATGIIRGRVVDAQTGRPLRRVRLNLTAPALGREGLSASTDSDGIYELTDVPSGRFTLSAQRGGYLPLRYGQRRPLEPGKPLELGEGQRLASVDFALPPMAAISGRIIDERGDPIAGVWVTAQRYVYMYNRRRLLPDGPIATTDEDGGYRITGLVPGTYLVNARTLEKWTEKIGGRDETMAYAPTFFPGVTDVTTATRVGVTSGQSVSNTDFALIPGRAAKISGTAVDSRGQPLKSVLLVHELMGTRGGLVGSGGSGTVAPDGRFEIPEVPPGEYKLQATGPQELVVFPISINGVDVTNVGLTTTAGWSARGAVVIDSDTPGGLPKSQVTVMAVSQATPQAMGMPGGVVPRQVVNDDWTFAVTGVVGSARLRVNLPEGWALKAALQGDRDIADVTHDFASGQELAGLQLVVTDRVATVTGQVLDQKGTAGPDGTVLLFPVDTSKWYEGSRFVRAARPDQKGQYRISNVLPGEYLMIALDYVEDGMWNDPEYLGSIRQDAEKLTLASPTTQSVLLKMVVR